MQQTAHPDGRQRVVIESVEPEIDGGRFASKAVVGDRVEVEADVFSDGHDAVSVELLHRRDGQDAWKRTAMRPVANDRWRGSFPVREVGSHRFTVRAWVDHFTTWRRDLRKKVDAGQDVAVDLEVGARLLEEAADRAQQRDAGDPGVPATASGGERTGRPAKPVTATRQGTEVAAAAAAAGDNDPGADAAWLRDRARELRTGGDAAIDTALEDERLPRVVAEHPDREHATRYRGQPEVLVERPRARFSAWYEMFPRSAGEGTDHGTFADCERLLPYVETMGFDVLYLPPIHPIGRTHRKGAGNAPSARPGEPGSPWAIGAAEGGHRSIHPRLGTLEDFRSLVRSARDRDIEVALDLAFQCSPDHPWVKEHPDWFRHRPDGSIQYAENPPKKYQDIYPLDFETDAWRALWDALLDVVLFWIDQGVEIFRVDNPHTKPFAFWEWLIARVREDHPEVLFLSEAFTRPKVMYRLGKVGFSQSYTYFAWRNTKAELTDYLTEVTRGSVRRFFRPNLWPNTPDILTEQLQTGGRPAFVSRLVLAATLGASYGIYGPAFELCADEPLEPGSEEYLDSEKYQIRDWDLDDPDSLAALIARLNRARRDNPALHRNDHLTFHPVDNDQLLCYSKRTDDGSNVVLVVVNLSPHHTHSGWVHLLLDELDVEPDRAFQVHDLLSEARFLWQGSANYLELDPRVVPAHVFRIRRRTRTERDFEYFL